MAKYGDFRYGSGTLYGADEDPVIIPDEGGINQWILQVDWNNDGSYDGTNEAAWWVHMPTPGRRGHSYYLAQGGNGFEGQQDGRFSLQLDNSGKRYDPYNTASPLYGNIVPGRKAKIMVKDIATGTTYTVFTGFIDDIRPNNDEEQTVTLDLIDGWKYLKGNTISTSQVTYRSTISACISDALTLAGWSAGRSIDGNTQPIVRWALDQADAGSTIEELASASLGNFFVDKYGKAVYYSRTQNSQTTHNIDQAQVLKEIHVSTPWENVRNLVTCVANKPMKGALVDIVALPSPIRITIPSSTWKTVTLDLSGDFVDVVFNGVEASTQPGGGGVDITNVIDYTYSIGAKTVTFSFSTPVSGYVNAIHLMGRELTNKPVKFTSTNTASRAAYGNRKFLLDNQWLQNINHADAFAPIILAALKDPSKAPQIIIQGRPDIQFSFELFDKVALTSAALEIDDTFYIGQIEYAWLSKGGQDIQTILTLQPLIYDNSTIEDDPYDPGLPEIPEIPGGGGGTLPPPTEVLLDCINDPAAAQNGPYTIFSNANFEILSTTTLQQQFDIPCTCVVRMGESDYPTYLTLYAVRTFYFEGAWYQTNNDSFYEIWAIDSVGSPLFQADEIVTQGDYITATFHPSVGTIVAGFRVKLIAGTIYDFDIGYTFDFYGGSQGWTPAPQNASYPLGDIFLPASTRTPWDTRYFDWTTGKLTLTPNSTQDYYATDAQNVWCFFPLTKVYGKADATMSGTVTNVYDSTGFVAIGILFTDNSWDYAEGPGLKTATISGANVGKEVKAFQWHVGTKDPSGDGTWHLDNVTIQGWTTTPASSFKITLKAASISNICAIP